MMDLEEAADELDSALTDYRTWLPAAVRERRGKNEVLALRELCNEVLHAMGDD